MGTYKNLQNGSPEYKVEIPPHKFITTKQAWDRHMLDTLGHVRIWRRLVFILSGLLLITSSGLVVVGLQPSEIPYIIEMTQDGMVRARDNVATQYSSYVVSESVREYQIRRFIHMIRSLGSDTAQLRKNWQNAMFMSTAIVEGKLKEIEQTDQPLTTIQTIRRDVTIDTVLHQSDTTTVVQWTESSWNKLDGSYNSIQKYLGVFEVLFLPPDTETMLQQNLLSLYISGFEMNELGGEG